MKQNLSDLEKIIGLRFKDKDLLQKIFVHRSYLNEHPKFKLDNNERLEFLGDAVLELIVTEYLYRNYTNPEGELTNWRSALVKGEMLSKVAAHLKIGDFLLLSKGEEKSGGKNRELILANTFEALVGAIYLEFGYKDAKKFVETHLINELDEILEKKLYQDGKSRLQEWSQESNGATPNYKIISETGPDHAKVFTVGVSVGNEILAEGTGSSKQKAEQQAAFAALKKLKLA
ncbi:MAG: ribonuclease III [Patescibacteria group bacterium]